MNQTNEMKEKLKKYCYRYDSSVGKGWFDEERLEELITLFSKYADERLDTFANSCEYDGETTFTFDITDLEQFKSSKEGKV